MGRHVFQRLFRPQYKPPNNANSRHFHNESPSKIRPGCTGGEFTTSMGACASCGRIVKRDATAAATPEQWVDFTRQRHMGTAAGDLHPHEDEREVKQDWTGNSLKQDSSHARACLQEIDGRFHPFMILPETWINKRDPPKCIFSDDELRDSLHHRGHYRECRPAAKSRTTDGRGRQTDTNGEIRGQTTDEGNESGQSEETLCDENENDPSALIRRKLASSDERQT